MPVIEKEEEGRLKPEREDNERQKMVQLMLMMIAMPIVRRDKNKRKVCVD
jgi:hypothetical protein